MKSIFARGIVAATLTLGAMSGANADESAALFAGAETYHLRIAVYADPGCSIDQTAVTSLARRQFGKAPKLRAVAEQAIPDIMLTITVDIAAIPRSEVPEMCLYNVNARGVHPMFGKLRYSDKNRVIQALTFNKSIFSVIVPAKVQVAVETQLGKVLGMFFEEYALGNPYP